MDAIMITLRVSVYLMLMLGVSNATYKRWLPDTNFDNPDNWNAKRTPCASDVVIIPDESPVVYIQRNFTLKELALPKNGELIFGKNNAGFAFSDPSNPSVDECLDTDGDLEFIATQPKSWLNPSSWCSTPSERGRCDPVTPLLDVEKIPCAYDDVTFPKGHLYFVDLSEKVPKLTLKSMKIDGSSFSKNSFATYLTSDDGKRMFKTSDQASSKTVIDVTRTACTDMRGCGCGNDQPQIATKICHHVQKTCQRPHCKKTVEPVGACCKMCGALFNITRGYGFNFETFKSLIKDSFLKDASIKNGVNVTISVTYEGYIQIALNDLTGEKSYSLARLLKKDMDKDLANGGHRYAIDSVQLLFSMGEPITPDAHTGSGLLDKGAVAGIVIAIIIILVIIAVVIFVFVYHRSGREIPINIPKLPSVHLPSLPRIPVRLPRLTARVPAQPQTASHVDPGFANPLYDTSPFDDGNQVLKEMEFIAASQEVQPSFDTSAGFNNPLYGAQGAAMFSDPAKGSDEQGKETPAKPEAKAVSATSDVLIDFKKDSENDSTI